MAKEDLWTQDEVDPATFNLPVERGYEEWRLQRIQKAYCNAENCRRRDLAIKLAKKSDLRLAQVAMLYPLTKGNHISVNFGSAKPDHFDDMVSLQHFKIDEIAMSQFVNPGTVRSNIVPYKPKLVVNKEHSNMK